MTRIFVISIIMAFVAGFIGCRACLAPYDHCQPTFLPERGDQCMGELYRCGSNLGGMERYSDANGYCESCGGGSVEYYASNDVQTAEIEAPQYASVESESFAPEVGRVRSASFDSSEFALNNDGSEAY